MASVAKERAKKKHDRDFDELRVSGARRRRIGTLKFLVGLISVMIAVFAIFYIAFSYQPPPNALRDAKHALAESGLPWATSFLTQYEGYFDWLSRRGTDTEVDIFDKIAQVLIQSALSTGTPDPETGQVSLLSSIFLLLHFVVMRLTFFILACWRLWVMAVIVAIAYAVHQYHAYRGEDMLGQGGNGRLFYSGIRGALENLASNGAPGRQITGLACINNIPLAEAQKTELCRILNKYQASNSTNIELVARIHAYSSYPGYIAQQDEEVLLANYFEGAGIVENTEALLEQALMLQKAYRDGAKAEDFLPAAPAGRSDKVNLAQHRILLTRALHRVLTPNMRAEIAKLPAQELASIVLGLESGKIMAYGFEGGKWVKKSQYPHLCARSVIHSVVPYGKEYDYFSRQTIRQAIIYGSRMSAFAPVRFPIDMSTRIEAARQWVEVLMSCPHELETVSDEVEMVGLVREAHVRWCQHIIDAIMAADRRLIETAVVTPVNQLVFFPIAEVLRLLRKTLDAPTTKRLNELNELVAQRQRLHTMSLDESEPPSFERIFPPLSDQERKLLAANHGASDEDLQVWSALRLVLNSFGWLARRVGDYSVPESSIIFAVFKVEAGTPGANDLSFIGRTGMVPFRGSRFEAKWGRAWVERFAQASTVTMSETPEDYQKLMRGIDESKLKSDDFGFSGMALG